MKTSKKGAIWFTQVGACIWILLNTLMKTFLFGSFWKAKKNTRGSAAGGILQPILMEEENAGCLKIVARMASIAVLALLFLIY